MNRRDFWDTAKVEAGRGELFRTATIRSWRMSEDLFGGLRGEALPMVWGSLPTGLTGRAKPSWESFLDLAGRTGSFTLRKDLDALVRMERTVLREVMAIFPRRLVVGIEFPGNLRVIHSRPDPWILERPYATDHLHCDSWAGEPEDVVNLFIYLAVDRSASWMRVSDVDVSMAERLAGLRGDYAELNAENGPFRDVAYVPQPGQAILFDVGVPHRTIRGDANVRVSFDLRFRRTDPYTLIDERWNQPHTPWRRYWRLADSDAPPTFEERARAELEGLAGTQRALQARSDEIHRLQNLENGMRQQ